MYPLDVVKTRLQLQSHGASRGFVGIVKDLIKNEGYVSRHIFQFIISYFDVEFSICIAVLFRQF